MDGGAGTDRAVFSGPVQAYEIRRDKAGYRVTGPDGSDFLISIEEIQFDDTGPIAMSALRPGPGQTLRP